MMDYVLVRFGLPPAALGTEILDAIFVLNPRSTTTLQTSFLQKVYEGVKTSYQYIHEE